MKTLLRSYVSVVCHTCLVLLVAVLLLPRGVFAECKELKLVEYEDRFEAVCVGEPLTEAQKKANLDEERRQEAAAQRQRMEEQRRQRETASTRKAQEDAAAAAERNKKSAQPAQPPKPVDRNMINRPGGGGTGGFGR